MLGLLALVLSIGLVDSLNPSTVAPALYLATAETGARRVLSFIGGIVTVNLVGGLILTFGPGQLLLAAIPRPGPEAAHRLELSFGILMLALALVLWLQRGRIAGRLRGKRERAAGSSALLGAAIAAIELPTAFPYFAVIAAIVSSNRSALAQIALLALFNAAFVLPLCAIGVIRSLAGPRGDRLLQHFDTALQRIAPVLLPLVVALIAAALLVVGGLGVAEG